MVGLMPFPGNKFERKGPVLLSPSIVCQEGKEGARCLRRGDLFMCLDALAGDISGSPEDA